MDCPPFEPPVALMLALGHAFTDGGVLTEALTHASFRNESKTCSADNERLEFLGDAVLGAAMSHLLFDAFDDLSEGMLTRYKAVLVSEPGLARTAREIGLGTYLRLGRGEESSGGRDKDSVLANAMEAVIAAVYLDAGYTRVSELICALYGDRIGKVGGTEERVDFKTKFQERVQSELHATPCYAIEHVSGPDHAPCYEVIVSVAGDEFGRGKGRSKKAAEQSAAKAAYENLPSS
ncbi:MAG: ribonuclease-3 [Myxococcota bacterium]|jgi:ribonuclease-3